MLVLTNVQDNRAQPTSYSATSAAMNATAWNAVPWRFLWCSTARNNQNGTGSIGQPDNQATRTAQACYMRGLKEQIEFVMTSSLPWQWRRVVFSTKGIQTVLTEAANSYFSNLTSGGYARTVNEVLPATGTALEDIMFKGKVGSDWNDIFTASTDSSRIKIMYDRTRNLNAGAEGGRIQKVSLWHPMNKTLVYGDDENGGIEATSLYSNSAVGLGDVWVYDMFRPAYSGSGGLLFKPQATLYWHEK